MIAPLVGRLLRRRLPELQGWYRRADGLEAPCTVSLYCVDSGWWYMSLRAEVGHGAPMEVEELTGRLGLRGPDAKGARWLEMMGADGVALRLRHVPWQLSLPGLTGFEGELALGAVSYPVRVGWDARWALRGWLRRRFRHAKTPR